MLPSRPTDRERWEIAQKSDLRLEIETTKVSATKSVVTLDRQIC